MAGQGNAAQGLSCELVLGIQAINATHSWTMRSTTRPHQTAIESRRRCGQLSHLLALVTRLSQALPCCLERPRRLHSSL